MLLPTFGVSLFNIFNLTGFKTCHIVGYYSYYNRWVCYLHKQIKILSILYFLKGPHFSSCFLPFYIFLHRTTNVNVVTLSWCPLHNLRHWCLPTTTSLTVTQGLLQKERAHCILVYLSNVHILNMVI